MAKKKSNRGPHPSPMTIYMLCACAAGRCEFAGCNKQLFKDEITWEEFNKSNIAHIIASSPDGPRGDPVKSHQLSDKIENLMLLCLEHHKMVDGNPEKYNNIVLTEMKSTHEKAISEQCDMLYKQPTEIVMLVSPIKGITTVDISLNKAAEAVMPQKRPASFYGHRIAVNVATDYHSLEFWKEAGMQLEAKYNYSVKSIQELNPDVHFSVFPIAPIPLIIKLGYMMGDKLQLDIYQKTRTPDSWRWQTARLTNEFSIEKKQLRSGHKIALVLSLTADIAQERVSSAYGADVLFIIKAKRHGVDCISSLEDLSAFWHKYQEACEEIRNKYTETQEIAVFPAIPVSAAFEIGRRFMPGVYRKLKIFDDDNGFFETITIGG